MNRPDPSFVITAPTVQNALTILADTSHVVGEAYFPVVVEGLAKALDVRWAFICRFDPASPDKASTIAFWDNGPAENFVYELLNTPCADVASQGVCCYADNITSLYPFDQMLADIGAKSYAGSALRSLDGRVLGLVAVMDENPFAEPDTVEQIVNLFSARAAAELERLASASMSERLGKIVEASVSEAYVFTSDTCRFELVNRGARENLGYTMGEMRSLTPWDLKPEFTEEEFRAFVKPLREGDETVLRFETVHQRKDGTTYPVSVQLQFFPDQGGVFFASIIDETVRKAKEEHEKLILNEMNHRAKNLLAVVQALARQTASGNPDDYVARLEARICGLAASHDVLVQNSWGDVPFEEIIHSQLAHFDPLIGKRISISGPPVMIKAEAAQAFGLALHELATNASKYGALSNDAGTIEITWEELDTEKGRCLNLSWTERGGPPVIAPSRSGFGSLMIQKSLSYQFDSSVELDFDPDGLRCNFMVPVAHLYSS